MYSYWPTGKCSEIVDLVYKFRFINRHQIQKTLHHKDPRRINSWLKELVDYKVLGRIYSKKLLENTKPAIYYLSYAGILYIKAMKHFNVNEVKKFYEDKKRSKTFIDHCIFVCQLLVGIKNYDNEFRRYDIFSKEQLIKHDYLNELKPDGLIELYKRKTKRSKEKEIYNRFLLDVIDPGVPRYAIRYRIKQYIEFHEQESWKEFADDFPYVLLVFPTKQKQKQFSKYIKTQLTEGLFTQGMIFLLTSYQEAMKEGLKDGISQEVRGE